MEVKKKVLFLCTGNSCRSQMAEGLVNHYLGDEWQAFSAGTAPAGYVHPMAIQVMSELDIDISKQYSKTASSFYGKDLDLVVTVCDGAKENCPVWLPAPGAKTQGGNGHKVHIGFEDPAEATGTEKEQLAVFRRVRDEIRTAIFHQLANTEVNKD
jgi:arsenate reductase